MNSVLTIAGIVKEKYKTHFGCDIEEIRLHKLLYFIQKEAYVVYGEPLFAEDLEGWMYGPVCVEVRQNFQKLYYLKSDCLEVNEVINNVLERYGELSIGALISLTHQETSWKQARIGLTCTAIGRNIISKDEIKKEAKSIEAFDELWGCSYECYDDFK